ncbi:hypothetical protein HanRHA438_Chr04g0182391 [Helianthus annuus]|uniref:DUF4283 domain-containing protein n=1 Tax=Helianthus annuus TaxID=4232 RepID=A0A9K3J8Y6_HELAN|nr:hypothetical protein HanXRQr2_Chr04g0172721 [Helianthus annuus]KAJ0581486.1 hypothetical protein HanHA300_Chr04g0141601 [Helianthus annuus]KAJ0589441.1 hypothetical protein HanIR_Chr04g0186301 [Helianthus annuus]KAJ0597436.1 hypothetical protein HanHA89_Chr04g0154601 [Helianthus annuus]KAJ0761761.1 hypothetical protein HanOQP8_Chr04g0153681 [Helianthus annuus]
MGAYKLFIMLARFVDGEKVKGNIDENKGKGKDKVNGKQANPNAGRYSNEGADAVVRNDIGGGGRSFLDSVLNRHPESEKIDTIKIDDNLEAFCGWHGTSLMGKVVDIKLPISLRTLLRDKGWDKVSIKYVSGLTVMLVFKDVEECDRFLENVDTWKDMFGTLDKWNGNNKVEDERIAWLQVHEVPLQLAIDQVFNLIGGRYGVVVQPACMSADDANFSNAYIGVLSKSHARVSDRVDLLWRGVSFHVWIDEDVGEWLPDCVEEFDAEGDEGSSELFRNNAEREENVRSMPTNEVDTDMEMGEIRSKVIVQNSEVNENANVLKQGAEFIIGRSSEVNENNVNVLVRKKYRKKTGIKNRGGFSGSSERPKK